MLFSSLHEVEISTALMFRAKRITIDTTFTICETLLNFFVKTKPVFYSRNGGSAKPGDICLIATTNLPLIVYMGDDIEVECVTTHLNISLWAP